MAHLALSHSAYGCAAATSAASSCVVWKVPRCRSAHTIWPGPSRPLRTTFGAFVSTSPRTPTCARFARFYGFYCLHCVMGCSSVLLNTSVATTAEADSWSYV